MLAYSLRLEEPIELLGADERVTVSSPPVAVQVSFGEPSEDGHATHASTLSCLLCRNQIASCSRHGMPGWER
jgi:hypothetical protein